MENGTDGAATAGREDVHPGPGPTEDGGRIDPVDEMVDESFPASDPPSGWAGQDPRDVPGRAR